MCFPQQILIRENPATFLATLIAVLMKVERYVVFYALPAEIPQPDETEERRRTIFRQITDEELAQLSYYREQAERFHCVGFNAAYGLYFEDELVHVAWLIDADLNRKNSVRNVKLQLGQGEITYCLTGKEYRDRGFYPLAIRYLCSIAVTGGIKQVFMITGVGNRSSQRGIEKAGLSRCGMIWRIIFPLGPRWLYLIWRGYRLTSHSS